MTDLSSVVIDQENPWPGLLPFGEGSERFFNGRRNEIAELRRLVLNAPLTVLFGASGLGKTSLIQAGLFPALRKDHILPVYVRLDVRDRKDPLVDQAKSALREQIAAQGIEAPPFNDDESLWQYLHRADLEIWSVQNQLLTPLFVFDQFEEVFTLGAENAAAIERLRVDLADLVENRVPATLAEMAHERAMASGALSLYSQRYKVLLSFREDFFPVIDIWRTELPSLLRNRLRLRAMSREQAFEAVHITASHLASVTIAAEIVEFVATAQENETGSTLDAPTNGTNRIVEPALLSLVCQGLNEKRKALGKEVFDQALLNGSGRAIISDYYQNAVMNLPDRVEQFIENELITERGHRKPCDRDDAEGVHEITKKQLQLLVDRRLLRLEPGQHGTEQVWLIHDLLTGVVREHRDLRRERERVRQQRRRISIFGAIGVLLAGLLIVVSVLYRQAKQQAKIAMYGRLAVSPIVYKNNRLDMASLLAVEAKQIGDTLVAGGDFERFEARNALLSTFQANPTLWTYLHHHSYVRTVAFSPDGKILASAGDDQKIRLWDVASRQPIGEPFQGHTDTVRGIAFSPDGRLLASASYDRTIRLWSVASHQPVGEPLRGHTDIVRSVAFSPDGKLLASASLDSTIRIWDVASQKPFGECTYRDKPVYSVAFSPDGHILATGGDDKKIWLWDVTDWKPLGTPLQGHTKRVTSVIFSLDGKLLASASVDGTVRLWDVSRRRPVGGPLAGHTQDVNSVAFSPDGKVLASASDDGTVRLWEVASRKPLGILTGHTRDVNSVAFSSNGKLLASASDDWTVRLWNLANRDPFQSLVLGRVQHVNTLAFSPDGKLLGTGSVDKPAQVQLWDLVTRQPLGPPFSTAGGDPLNNMAFSPDGKLLAAASSNKMVLLWDIATRRSAPPLLGHSKSVTSVAFSPDGKLLASASLDTTIRLWDVASSQSVGSLVGHSQPVTSVAFSPDGKLLASASLDATIRLWDVATRQPLGEPFKAGPADRLNSVAFSPDGKLLAAASESKIVLLWDVASRRLFGASLQGHTDTVTNVTFSPDGKLLASASLDMTVRLWDVASRQPFEALFQGNTNTALNVAFSPDGKLLATVSDRTIRLWDMNPDSWAERPCRLANRNLSFAEWQQYMGQDIRYHRTCPDLPDGEGVPVR